MLHSPGSEVNIALNLYYNVTSIIKGWSSVVAFYKGSIWSTALLWDQACQSTMNCCRNGKLQLRDVAVAN